MAGWQAVKEWGNQELKNLNINWGSKKKAWRTSKYYYCKYVGFASISFCQVSSTSTDLWPTAHPNSFSVDKTRVICSLKASYIYTKALYTSEVVPAVFQRSHEMHMFESYQGIKFYWEKVTKIMVKSVSLQSLESIWGN